MNDWVRNDGRLPYVEMEDCGQSCEHCGATILAFGGSLYGYLAISPKTNEPSFHCDPADLSRPHKPKTA